VETRVRVNILGEIQAFWVTRGFNKDGRSGGWRVKSSSNVIDPQLYIEGGAVSLAGTTREQALHVHTLLAIILRLLVIFCAESATTHSQQTPKVYARHVSTSPYISSCFMASSFSASRCLWF
jgi:hypothetical protein